MFLDEKAQKEFLDRLYLTAKSEYIPLICPEALTLLIDILKKTKPKRILEIGTALGYSAMRMRLASMDSEIITIEKDTSRFNLAVENFEKASLTENLTALNLDAFDYLKENSKSERFDFIFLDGAKGQYLKYYPYLIDMLNEKGVLFSDNVFFNGLVKKAPNVPHKHRTIAVNLKEFLKVLKEDSRLSVRILDLADGVAIATKNKAQSD